MNIKEKGSFYTPSSIAHWIAERAQKSLHGSEVYVLEPSCGDGVFLSPIHELMSRNGSVRIDAIEHHDNAYQVANTKHHKIAKIKHKDFLFWQPNKQYDAVLGNPPYIVKKTLTVKQADKCRKIHENAGLKKREVANIWTAFLIKSTEHLNENGILGFVLPTELLQVNYAKEVREFLFDNFKRIEIISFQNLAFDNIEQDTVILMAYKKPVSAQGLYFSEVSSIDELISKEPHFEKHHGNHDAKWSSYILSANEMAFITEISRKCSNISELCTSVAGIVTAANGYFIVTQEDVDKYDLKKYVKQIIQKGMYVNGSAEILPQDYKKLRDSSKPCFIIDLNNIPESRFSSGLKKYLTLGIDQNIQERYKCRLRQRWHDVPSIWKSEGFFFKRGHHYPKLLVNKADVYVTDSAYRVRMNEGYDIQSFASSFYNSLTLLHAELSGRYYGGGVLEITPNEFKRLPVPYSQISNSEYKIFSSSFKSKTSIENFLEERDKTTLGEVYGLPDEDIKLIQSLYKKVKNRRLKGRYT